MLIDQGQISQVRIGQSLEPMPFDRSEAGLRQLVSFVSRVIDENRCGLANWKENPKLAKLRKISTGDNLARDLGQTEH